MKSSSNAGPQPKPIVAKDQVRLGAARCLQLAVSGMAYRMFRSSVTVAILALAVAFVVHMLSFGLLEHETERGAELELQHSRRLGQDITRLSTPDPMPMVVGVLGEGDAVRVTEYARWAKAPPERMANARRIARRLQQVEAYFSDLPPAARATIVGDRTPQELLDHLRVEATLDRTLALIRELNLPPPLGDAREFRRLLAVDWPSLAEFSRDVESGHREAIGNVLRQFPGKTPNELASSPPRGLHEALRAAGFEITRHRLAELSRYAQRLDDVRVISRLLLDADVSSSISRKLDIELGKVNFNTLAARLTRSDRAKWLSGVLRKAGAPARLTAKRLGALAEMHRREQELGQVIDDRGGPQEAAWFGLSERNMWLVALSFLVCIVGVANAMLMSVTERFTEIATMKCLGAMDRFVMMMFVFEAILQGAVGGLLGLVLGGLLALVRAAIDYGGLLWDAGGAAGSVGLAMLGSLVIGMALAAVAAVGPSWIAARLAPMEAMRVE